jgi:hypothetical protein
MITRQMARERRKRATGASFRAGIEQLEPRSLMAVDTHMAVGMNLENVVDWSPAWTFTDVFQASRPWIAHAFNTATWATSWEDAATPRLALDTNGNVARLASWTNTAGQTMQQRAGTLMFRGLGGAYAAGTYRAEWDGTGTVTFGFDARVTAIGRTAAGRSYADLTVTPTDAGIYMVIESTDPANPARNFNVWMPDWQGQRFAGQQWEPGAAFSPFHPLFLERLAPFDAIRFMGMQETNTSDIRTWADRRDASDIRQGSGPQGTASEPIVNGMSVEYMVQLANDLDADPWFNMPHQADDTFVRNFATYVRDHLEPGRKAYVEWANEVWNFGWGFEASQWVAQQAAAQNLDPDYGQWIVAGREAKRDMDVWSSVFAGQTDRLVRVAAGWAAVDWVTGQITEAMEGSFDAIAIAPYITPTDGQRASYSGSTTVDRVLADTRANIATSLAWTASHERLAQEWTARLGRPIQLVAYEGGHHLDGRGGAYQGAFYAATNDPRMGDIYRDYLTELDAAGMDLFVDFQFTGPAGATPWGDFAKLHRMDEPLATAYRYSAVVAAADGSLWQGDPLPPPPLPPPPPSVSIGAAMALERNTGRSWMTFTLTLSTAATAPVTVNWATANGTALAGRDYVRAVGKVTFAAGQITRTLRVAVIGDRVRETNETFRVTLRNPVGATLSDTAWRAIGRILDDDTPAHRAAALRVLAAAAAEVETKRSAS